MTQFKTCEEIKDELLNLSGKQEESISKIKSISLDYFPIRGGGKNFVKWFFVLHGVASNEDIKYICLYLQNHGHSVTNESICFYLFNIIGEIKKNGKLSDFSIVSCYDDDHLTQKAPISSPDVVMIRDDLKEMTKKTTIKEEQPRDAIKRRSWMADNCGWIKNPYFIWSIGAFIASVLFFIAQRCGFVPVWSMVVGRLYYSSGDAVVPPPVEPKME